MYDLPMPRMSTGQAQRLMQHRLSGRIRDLRICLCEQGTVLHGRALTPYARQAVEHELEEALGLPIASDEIEG